jgi:hypothetical protein
MSDARSNASGLISIDLMMNFIAPYPEQSNASAWALNLHVYTCSNVKIACICILAESIASDLPLAAVSFEAFKHGQRCGFLSKQASSPRFNTVISALKIPELVLY